MTGWAAPSLPQSLRRQSESSAYALRERFPEDLADAAPRVALVGCGWYGKCDLSRLLQVAPVEVVGLCDVDQQMLAGAAEVVAARQLNGAAPPTFGDHRAMLAETRPDLVIVNTPDHWHALQTIDAIQAGCDVYVQKPISVDVAEGAAMLAAAREHGRVVQVGLQRRSTPHLIEARNRYVNEDMLGRISHVEIYGYYHMRSGRPVHETSVPEHLDWDAYCGPAPLMPYNEVVHPRGWRNFKAFGNGILGDIGVHMLDTIRWMLDLGAPQAIASIGGTFNRPNGIADIPDTQTVTFAYEDLSVVWQHRTWGNAPDRRWPWAASIYGDKGTLNFDLWKYEFTPRGRRGPGEPITGEVGIELDAYPEDRHETQLEHHAAPAIRYHMMDFLRRIEDRGRPVSDIEEGHISTAACALGNLALDLQRTLHWDGHEVRDDAEANAKLQRMYRGPWEHPGQSRADAAVEVG